MILHCCGTQPLPTPRLQLRRFVPDDAEAMYRNWASDSDVCRYLTWDPHESVAETQATISRWADAYQDGTNFNWAIELKAAGEVIGSIAVVDFSEKHQFGEIGYCIGKQFWGQGYTTEALQAVIRFLFTEVGLNRIIAQHDTQNAGSGRVMEKAGMRLEGTLRQRRIRRDGTFGDGHIWAILRDDYFVGN